MLRQILRASPRAPVPRAATRLPRQMLLPQLSLPVRMKATSVAQSSVSATAPSTAVTQGSHKAVGYWLVGTAGMVFVMVVLGGVTRLTRSGLSIVEWRPEGETLPRTDAEWQVEFDKYKAFPEYIKVNRHMSLDEFKPIYFMEWFHRMWGRGIGLAFAGPLAYFALRRRIPPGFGTRLGALLALGATQGAVGWWMVKSGLVHENFKENYAVPRVSPYRLTTHLGFAWASYSLLLWNAWDLLRAPLAAVTPQQADAARRMRSPVVFATSLLGVTIASGAFVAGNDAGHAYNDWPLFAGRVIPEQIWEPAMGLRNFFENTATVQFDHRMLAYSMLATVGIVHAAGKRIGWAALPAGTRGGAIAMGAMVGIQATLGISTLMMYVPVWLGAAHQAGALALWTTALYTLHSVQRALRPAAAAAAGTVAAAAAKAPVSAAAAVAALGLSATLHGERED